MRFLARTTVIAFTLLAAALAVASVSVDYEKTVDFQKYKSFSWREGTPAPSSISEKRIRNTVTAELETKGLAATEGEADLYVITHAKLDVQKHISGTTTGYGYHRSGFSTTSMRVHEVPVGTLVVDLVDAESNDLVWRGIATATLSTKPEKNEKKLKKVTRKMFKEFPPEAS